MEALSTTSLPPPLLQGLRPHAAARPVNAGDTDSGRQTVRQRVGEVVGDVFYGALLRQVQNSRLKGAYFHGGRGEDVFQGQLNIELARKIGQAGNNPIADRLTKTIQMRLQRQGHPLSQPEATVVPEVGRASQADRGSESTA